MASFERHSDVTWEGSISEGKGQAAAGTGAFTLPVTFPARVGEPAGMTSPEELIAAAHAACYAMALSGAMGRRNASATRLKVTATVRGEFAQGVKIEASHLKVVAEGLQGVAAADFPQFAREAEQACPVSNALRGSLKIDVDAQAV
ncbi:MAG TPA: OsmC family peroxiredoxin [Vicinamibacterales bacterium]|nr:OsmC family peroxiredoxin [Vicinamibacterales bacterium]